MEKSEAEEDLAITNLVSKSEHRHREGLFAIEQRFGHLAGIEISESNNPVSPRHIAEAFRQASKELPVDLTIRLVVYKLFDRYVTSELEPLYDEINILLIQAGVMPHLAYQPRHSASSHAASGHRQEAGPATTAQGYPGEPGQVGTAELTRAVTTGVFDGLRNLLRQQRETEIATSSPGATVITTDSRPYSLDELIQTLNHLQQSPQPTGTGLRTLVIGELPQLDDPQHTKTLPSLEADVIDLVEMLFQFILDDDSLADALRAQIARLQIPVLKAAILDKDFFNSQTHPARQLLDELAHAAIGWTEADGRAEGGLFKRIESLVEKILNGFQNDVSVFQGLLEEFRGQQADEARTSQQFEVRASQVARGQETLATAKLRVGEAIEVRMLDREVPEFITKMLRDGWSALLVLIHLREGEQSESWKRNLTAVDELLWSIEPKTRQEDRQELIRKMPTLLKCFREGLNNISYDPYGIAHFFKELQAIHLQRLKAITEEPVIPAPIAETQPEATAQPAAEEPPASSAEPRVPDEFDHAVAQLPTGTWFQWQREDGQSLRAKLAWRSNTTGRCLLVNRRGLKIEEMESERMAGLLREHKAKVISGGSLIDRALGAIRVALGPRETQRQ